MKPFTFERANSAAAAAAAIARNPTAKFIAGGTNLLDLMKLKIEVPTHLVDVHGLDQDKIEATSAGGLRVGALVRNTALAADERVRRDYTVLSRALLSGEACNKRQPGSGCSALDGVNRQHGVVGISQACIATHPSDMSVAMRLLEATVHTVRADGRTRKIPIADFYRLPGDTLDIDTQLERAELITAFTLPRPIGGIHIYRKVRDRASYAFALTSVAAIVQRDGSGRVAVGGVAHKPWRLEAAEVDMPAGAKAVTAKLLADARPPPHHQCD